MKRIGYGFIGALVLMFIMLGIAWATESAEEQTLHKETTGINSTANTTHGTTVVTQRLEKEFNVTDTQIQGLREKKLGYGEIAIVCSLAGKLPGGVTDANIAQILSLRQGPPVQGWGEIAKKLGTKLGPVVSQVRNINSQTHRDLMHNQGHGGMHHDMSGHGGMGGGSGMGSGSGMGGGMSHGGGR